MPHILRQLPDGPMALYAWFGAMHTRIDILIKSVTHDAAELISITEEIRLLINDIESEGNCFNPGSLLAAYNRNPIDILMSGGEYLYDMLSLCKRYNALTQGLFDVTINSENHNQQSIDEIIIAENGCIGRCNPGTTVNLSGFIKGYALDRIKTLLSNHKIADAMVNMGNSSILTIGNQDKSHCQPYITTSGNTEGQPCQIINPHTGKPVTRCGTVQVATCNGADGEVLATAFFITEPHSDSEAALLNAFPQVSLTRNHN